MKDHMGKTLEALEVFSKAIKYLKEEFFKSLKAKDETIIEKNIHWVITVPAIWDEFAKSFMRQAAEKVYNFIVKLSGILCTFYLFDRTFNQSWCQIPKQRYEILFTLFGS